MLFLRSPRVGPGLPDRHDARVSVAIRSETGERPIPFTYERALTELFRCRRGLGTARSSLELVLAIIGRLDAQPDLPAPELGELLGRLEEAEAALRQLMTEAGARS